MMSPQCGVGKIGPVCVPWPFGAGSPLGSEIALALTCTRMYAFETDAVGWQIDTFCSGVADPGEGQIQSKPPDRGRGRQRMSDESRVATVASRDLPSRDTLPPRS